MRCEAIGVRERETSVFSAKNDCPKDDLVHCVQVSA
jgi:hypothetical protein